MSEGGDGAIELRLDGDATGLVRAAKAAAGAQDGLTRTEKALKKAAEDTNKDLQKQVVVSDALKKRNEELAAKLERATRISQQQGQSLKHLSADYERMVRDTGTAINKAAALERQMAKTGDAMKDVGTRGGSALTGLGGKITTVLSGLVGVGGVLGTIKLALEDIEKRAEVAKGAALTVEAAEAGIATNLPKTGNAQEDVAVLQDTIARGREIAARRNMPVSVVQGAIAEGLSASGGDIEATLSVVDLQAELNRATPGDLAAGVSGNLQATRLLGVQDAAVAQGLFEVVSEYSNIPSPAKIAENFSQVGGAAKAYGFDQFDAAALFSAMTSPMSDGTGERTRTAMNQFMGNLSEFFTEGGGKRIQSAAVAESGYGLGLGEMIATLQNDGALQAEFLKDMRVEGSGKPLFMEMLQQPDTSDIAKNFVSIREKIPMTEEGLAAKTTSRREMYSSLPSVAIGDAERGMKSIIEDARLDDTEMSMRGVFSPEALDEVLSSAGLSWGDRWGAKNSFLFNKTARGQEPQEAFMNTVEGRIEGVRFGERLSGNDTDIDDKLTTALNKLVVLQERSTQSLKNIESKQAEANTFSKFFESMESAPPGTYRTPIRNP